MRIFPELNAALIGTSIALIQPYIAIAAPSAADVNKIATGITVRIVDAGTPSNSGSGVIIKQTGNTYTVLTALHVAKDGTKNLIAPDDKSYPLKNIKPLPDLDLAIAEFSSNQKYAVAKIGNSDAAIRTTKVYVAGFPGKTAAINNPDLFLTDGTVNANGKPQRDGYNILYSNNTLRGMSGGAVLNDNGELVAIHGRADEQEVGEKSQSKVVTGIGITDYNQAIKIDPNFVLAYINRGNVRYQLGDKQGAIADYNQAIKINPNFALGYTNRGVVRYQLGDKQGAIADLNQAIKINPNFALAYNNRGIVRYQLGDNQGAIADLNQAIKIDPKFRDAITNIGLIKYEDGDIKTAMKQWREAVAIDNKSAEPLLALAVALYTQGDREQAVSKAKQALTLDKTFADEAVLKKNNWGKRLITDAKKLLATPEMRGFLSNKSLK
jgi:Tfp pilus assembly protein PilF